MEHDVTYNVVVMDDDGITAVDIIEDDFETIEGARKYLARVIKVDIEDNHPQDRSIFRIEKVTRELIE